MKEQAVKDEAIAVGRSKLCKDCRWAQYDKTLRAWLCLHQTSLYEAGPDLVTGEKDAAYQLDCRSARTDSKLCGKEGRYWEARDAGTATTPS